MKKLLILLLSVVGIFTMAACGTKTTTTNAGSTGGTDTTAGGGSTTGGNGTTIPAADQARLDLAKSTVTVPENVDSNFTLAVTAAGGVTISWTSSAPAIAISGDTATVTRPDFADGDAVVTLTATFTVNGYSVTKDYTVNVTKKADVEEIQTVAAINVYGSSVGDVLTVKGTVSAILNSIYTNQSTGVNSWSAQGFYLVDGSATIYVYGYQLAEAVTVGQEVIVKGTVADYKGIKQLSSPELVSVVQEGVTTIPMTGALRGLTIADVNAEKADITSYGGATIIFENVTIKKNQYGSYLMTDGTNSINVYSAGSRDLLDEAGNAFGYPEWAWLDQYVTAGTPINVMFFMAGQSGSGNWRGIPLAVIPTADLPELTDALKLQLALNKVSVPENVLVAGTIALPTEFQGVSISWVSNNPSLISNAGVVSALPDTDTVVTLTATFTIGSEAPVTHTYTVTVKSAVTEYPTIATVLTGADGAIVSIEGIVVGLAKYGYYVYDGTGYIYVNNAKGTSFTIPAVGDVVIVPNAEYDTEFAPKLYQKANPVASTKSITAPQAEVKTLAEINALATTDRSLCGNLITVTGTVSKQLIDGYDAIVISDANGNKLVLDYSTSRVDPLKTYASQIGQEVTITVILHQYHTTKVCWLACDLTV